jgi:hypothetical protein
MLVDVTEDVEPNGQKTGERKKQRGWLLLLVLPYLGLCFPQTYVRTTPRLFGFPFFYWYQFAWVIATSAILWVFYRRTRRTHPPRPDQSLSA